MKTRLILIMLLNVFLFTSCQTTRERELEKKSYNDEGQRIKKIFLKTLSKMDGLDKIKVEQSSAYL